MTILDLYNEFRKQTFFVKKNIYPKPVKSLENISNQEQLVHFEKFKVMVESNAGMIDWRLYIKSLAIHYKGWFKPSKLNSLKAIKIYKTYVILENENKSGNIIYRNVLDSIKFIVNYCKENNIKNFDDYINDNITIIPTILKHHKAGSISSNFLSIIPNIKIILNSFPKDCVDQFCKPFFMEYESIRMRTIKIEQIRKIDNCLDKIIDNLIVKK